MDAISCTMCGISNWPSQDELFRHIIKRHKNDPNFIVHCKAANCMYSTRRWENFKVHISRVHKYGGTRDHADFDDFNNDFDEFDGMCSSETDFSKSVCARYMLQMECQYRLPQTALNNIAICTNDLITDHVKLYQKQVENHEISAPINDETMQTALLELSSQFKRKKYYLEHCGLVHCQEVKIGERYRNVKGRLVKKDITGYVVPLRENLEHFLNMPEVWYFLNNGNPQNTNELMFDIGDGSYVRNHPLFIHHPHALQIIMSCDDLEIVNPIGAHVKKHKICMFYFTLANIPPQFRSKLSILQLIGVAKTQDLRDKKCLKLFLSDFTSTVKQLRSIGIDMVIRGKIVKIFGDLVLCPCDTLAAQWLGGFKEGVSFALKGCRTCTASSSAMKTVFDPEFFAVRDTEQHTERCNRLEKQKDPRAQKYWSKMWGINFRSPLLAIDESLPISVLLVHDPMHILLEGVLPYEMALLLHHCVIVKKMMTLAWLNAQIQSYFYSYLDAGRKPELITLKDIQNCKIKQTSGAMLTLCYILPHILGLKVGENCAHWLNCVRLLQVVLIATSPYADATSAGQLEQVIVTHHHIFKELYPQASIIPKMHYCLHLPKQLLLFGPLRNQWCMRFEAKHGFFKEHKWKCFKNVPKSLAEKHQLWMCFKMLGSSGMSTNYVYSGDVVAEGVVVSFADEYPSLVGFVVELLRQGGLDESSLLTAYQTPEVTIHGHKYRPGVGLSLACTGDLTEFALVECIYVFSSVKCFVIEKLETREFNQNVNSYLVISTGQQAVICYTDLVNKWPLPVFVNLGEMYITDRYPRSVYYIG